MAKWNNSVRLQGYAGTVPTIQNGANGSQSARFRLAVKRKHNGVDKTDWFTVWANGKQASMVQANIGKGTKVLVDGSIVLNERPNKTGQMQLWADVWADNIVVVSVNTGLGDTDGESEASATPAPSAAPAPAQAAVAPAPPVVDDSVPDDPPF